MLFRIKISIYSENNTEQIHPMSEIQRVVNGEAGGAIEIIML
jgi:hypothetical protein